MPDRRDPLGRRALFWAPAQRTEEGPRTVMETDAPGKHALFSPTGGAARRAPSTTGQTGQAPPRGIGRASRTPPPSKGAGRTARRAPVARPPSRDARDDRRTGVVVRVACSSCKAETDVDLVEYLCLHLPVWLWRPGRGYTRFMTCPACRRRTWLRTSWAVRIR